MTIWFTADHHFNHTNIIKYCNRPFETIEEMNNVLIKRWNEVVKKGDTVYHLGDFAFGDPTQFRRCVNGDIHLIIGNHDTQISKLKQIFSLVTQQYMVKQIQPHIWLNHYKMCVWDRSHYGVWHLYGHSHGGSSEENKMLSFDIGVDTHNFYPYSYEEVKEKMAEKIERCQL